MIGIARERGRTANRLSVGVAHHPVDKCIVGALARDRAVETGPSLAAVAIVRGLVAHARSVVLAR